MTIDEAFQIALQHHQSGRLAEAEALYRQILAAAPQHADAQHLLGVIAHQVGRSDLAVGMITQAIALSPVVAAYHSNLGEALRVLGRIEEAVGCYQRALQLQPDFVDALSNLGLALAKLGRTDEAITSLRRAVALAPGSAQALSNLGGALCEKGLHEEAVEGFRRALALRPDFAEAHYNLGNVLRLQGHRDESAAAYHRAITFRPDYAEAHYNLGVVLGDMGRLEETVAAYREAVRCRPGYADAGINLGNALLSLGRAPEAADAYRAVLAANPAHVPAHYNLGNALAEMGLFSEAVTAFREALRMKPDSVEALNNLGGILMKLARRTEAAEVFREALRLRPDHAAAQSNLGALYSDLGHIEAALTACRRAVELKPDFPEAWSNLAGVLKDAGRVDEAIAADRRALELQPDFPKARSNLLFDLHYAPDAEPAEIFAEHRRWDELCARRFTMAASPLPNERDPGRRLRVGYVSPDFREHSVAFFFEALLEHHDPAQVEVFCYQDSPNADSFTARMRRRAAHWRETHGRPDEKVAALIREDAPDILVDLAGHTADNRLLVFARRLAPVQVSWLGYFDTTGLDSMDWRITDAHADPPGMTEHLHSERLWRMPDTFACFRPAEMAPVVSPLPALAKGAVTFACFHNLPKLNDALLAMWAGILNAVTGSRLLMIGPGLDEDFSRGRMMEFFSARGVDPARLELRGRQKLAEYLAAHAEADVLLDAHPFSGHTVACHALWMGLPVVTLSGATHSRRMVTSVLRNLGRPEWIAATPEEYVGIATGLVSDLAALAEIRAGLRSRMAASPLTDGARFARNVEQAYREMWRAWCVASQENGAP